MVPVTKYLTKRPYSNFRQFTPKLSTIFEEGCNPKHHGFGKLSSIPNEECDIFDPFSSDYPVSPGALTCFIFMEQFGHLIDENTPQSDLPPSCFPPLTYVPHSKPPKKDPPSRGINHLEDQKECIYHHEVLIDKICDDELPIPQITRQQQLEELSLVEILAKQLQEHLANESLHKKLKCFLSRSLPDLKQRMSGSVRK